MAFMPREYSSETRAALREIIAEYGPDALSRPSAVLPSVLQDLLPDAPAIVRMLVAATQERIADILRDHLGHGLDAATAVRLTAAAFSAATMSTPEASEWLTREIGIALSLIADADESPTILGAPAPVPALGTMADPSLPPDPAAQAALAFPPGLARTLPPGQRVAATAQQGGPLPATANGATVAAGAPGAPAIVLGSQPQPGGPWSRPVVRAVAVVAALGVIVSVLLVWAPWSKSLVLTPTGLTAESETTGSVTLGWSGPATGPSPDKYVISQNGTVIGSVPGTVTVYQAQGLAPDTGYQYQVMAVRGGQGSPWSAVLATSTLIPPVSAARLEGTWSIHWKIVASPAQETTFVVGKTWTDKWNFSPYCATGPCDEKLSGYVYGWSFGPTTLNRTGALYRGTATMNNLEYCYFSTYGKRYPIHTTVAFQVEVSQAGVSGGQWEAGSLVGTMEIHNNYTTALGAEYCNADAWGADLHG